MNQTVERKPEPLDIFLAKGALEAHLKAKQRVDETEKTLELVLDGKEWPCLYAIAETCVYANENVSLQENFFRLKKDVVILELEKRKYPKHNMTHTVSHGVVTRILKPTKAQLFEALVQ